MCAWNIIKFTLMIWLQPLFKKKIPTFPWKLEHFFSKNRCSHMNTKNVTLQIHGRKRLLIAGPLLEQRLKSNTKSVWNILRILERRCTVISYFNVFQNKGFPFLAIVVAPIFKKSNFIWTRYICVTNICQ